MSAPYSKCCKGRRTRERVREYLRERGEVRCMHVALAIGQSDASAHSHLQALVLAGEVVRKGTRYLWKGGQRA